MTRLLGISFCVLIASISEAQQHDAFQFNPEIYTCQQASAPISIDGLLSEEEWGKAPWTSPFVDIEGSIKPNPYYQTRAKMLWDDQFFYIAAELEEEHLWATYDQRDMVIFHENDFEVFIDPSGDTHNYYELEINALGTIWDLLLTKPYRDNGKAIDAWDINGLKSAVKLYGTLNEPKDKDKKWTIELAFPWKVLEEAALHSGPPLNGETWRVNFSRVHWRIENQNGTYQKVIDPKTGKSYPEYNWVWSPQGKIAMHQPETWGIVQFKKKESKIPDYKLTASELIKWELSKIYYQQTEYFNKSKTYTTDKSLLNLENNNIKINATENTFIASTELNGQKYYIREDGRIWSSPVNQ